MRVLFYSASYVLRRAGRLSPASQARAHEQLPAPEVVLVSGKSGAGWSLPTWREFANARRESLRVDLLRTIDELEAEESALTQRYVENWKGGSTDDTA